MLVERLIRETLEMQGFRIESVKKAGSELVVTIVPDLRYHPRCGVCNSPGDYRDTLSERRFRHVPLWAIPVILVYAPCRVTCPECKSVHVESMPWAAGKKRLTKAFARAIATWAKSLPWLQVACQWERKSVPVTGIEKCTTPWERTYQSGEAEMVESPPFGESCLAKAWPCSR